MNDLRATRITFTCTRCGSTNELTAAHLHQSTMIHCSHCSASVAPLGILERRPVDATPAQVATL